ncbi:hypothetical protein SCHPADRAFT_893022 [Schizopora paradoxa]|uniref:Uncharacterized protein n=1 Tax=Schizopora paradoxa TaxID=27342 RepID=A0A0H2RCQ1_9AGAM|nr:hypothetical protein SCHPADRAFT_893022 [Schizopora paradoxa]
MPRKPQSGERIFCVGDDMYKVHLTKSKSKEYHLTYRGAKTWIWRFFLDRWGKETISNEEKRDVLRHDADASKLTKEYIECRACSKEIKIALACSRAAVYDLRGWLIHKLCCSDLQESLREEYSGHAEEDIQEGPRDASDDNGPVGTKARPADSIDEHVEDQEEETLMNGSGFRKALARTCFGIEEVKIITSDADGRRLYYMLVELDGRRVTPTRFLTMRERKHGLPTPLVAARAKQDIDGEFSGNEIRCKACFSKYNTRRLCGDGVRVVLDRWLEHKFLCKDLQAMYRRELKSGSSAPSIQCGESSNGREMSRNTSSPPPSAPASNSTRRSTRASKRVCDTTQIIPQQPTPSTITREKRTLNSEGETAVQRAESMVCKRRRIEPSGAVNELEVEFSTAFTTAFPDIVANFLNFGNK